MWRIHARQAAKSYFTEVQPHDKPGSWLYIYILFLISACNLKEASCFLNLSSCIISSLGFFCCCFLTPWQIVFAWIIVQIFKDWDSIWWESLVNIVASYGRGSLELLFEKEKKKRANSQHRNVYFWNWTWGQIPQAINSFLGSRTGRRGRELDAGGRWRSDVAFASDMQWIPHWSMGT